MLAIQILAPLLIALSIIYIFSCLIILLQSLWEDKKENVIRTLCILILPIISFIFMILFYIYYM